MSGPSFDLRAIARRAAVREHVDGWIDGHVVRSYTVGAHPHPFRSRRVAEAFARVVRKSLIDEALAAIESEGATEIAPPRK